MVQINSTTTVSMLLSGRHDPNFWPEEPLGIFAFPTSPIQSSILGMFSFVPSNLPNSLQFFLIFPIPELSGAVCVTPSFCCCVYHPSICLHSLQRQLCFVWRGKGKQECTPIPNTRAHIQTPVTQMDHTTVQSNVTHKTFKNILLRETEMTDQ